jgi:putative transposase
MPRTARASVGGLCYHVLNRGNHRAEVYHGDGDYQAFVSLLRQACVRVPMRVLCYCLMPNHFHLVLWPRGDDDLGAYMHWLLTTHVGRYNRQHHTSGHVWQGRFKAFPIQEDDHLCRVLRYVERNPLRANLVKCAEEWAWSSLRERSQAPALPFLADIPIELGHAWPNQVNQPETEAELERLRQSVNRGMLYGDPEWGEAVARRLGLRSSLNSPGRPSKGESKKAVEESGTLLF